jgi:hypothetical protein
LRRRRRACRSWILFAGEQQSYSDQSANRADQQGNDQQHMYQTAANSEDCPGEPEDYQERRESK